MKSKLNTKALGGFAAVAFALFAFVPVANANLIVNDSFEATAQASGTWAIYSDLPGWTGGSAGIELRNNVAGAAYDGVNYVELDTTMNSLAYQNIATTLGQLYALSFAYSPRENVGASSNGIEVFWNGVSEGLYTGSGSNSGNSWVIENLIVTGTTSTSNLEFRATGTSDSYGGSLDAVSLDLAPVPEPATLAFLGLGLAGLAFARRKKA
jgi:hypothetical protein